VIETYEEIRITTQENPSFTINGSAKDMDLHRFTRQSIVCWTGDF
jgi:hypothetical protein